LTLPYAADAKCFTPITTSKTCVQTFHQYVVTCKMDGVFSAQPIVDWNQQQCLLAPVVSGYLW